ACGAGIVRPLTLSRLVHIFTPSGRTVAGLRRSVVRGVVTGCGVWLCTLDALRQDHHVIWERAACLIPASLAGFLLQVGQVARLSWCRIACVSIRRSSARKSRRSRTATGGMFSASHPA